MTPRFHRGCDLVTRDGNLWSLPPVCDTLYVSADGLSPAPWTLRACDLADRHQGDRVTVDQVGGLAVAQGKHDALERATWSVRVGVLQGFASYRYVWDGRGAHHGVTVLAAPPRAEGERWRWFVMLRAERLWQGWMRGLDALAVLGEVLTSLGHDAPGWGLLSAVHGPEAWKPSRVDICRDHGGYGWEIRDLGRFATRAPKWSRGIAQTACDNPEGWETVDDGWTYGNPDGTTFYVGRRRSETRFLRIYCKSTEARATGKAAWLVPFWQWALLDDAQGPLPKVWRAEVEFGGGWLKAHGLTRGDQLAGCERTLWAYYVEAVRHTMGHTKQPRHEASSPVWDLLATLPPADAKPAWNYQPRPERGPGDAMTLRKQAAGCAAAILERLYAPASEAEAEEGIDAILADLRERMLHRARGHGPAQAAPRPPLLGAPMQGDPIPDRAARLDAPPGAGEDAFG